ncbi:hybrid sensor histidine kinase/response regulator [candidate division KSB3 bacterium]|uniref:histidine kinase n=1 Tax=candidate division KSB3 bacterium TaxID=2044937 RepID=A0A2G6E2W5_9BACT|nr:MAG: hybrid sensor histidine kinase/response regulator [candidate division KSB3 bacterium]PIE28870.1 MAG: hybrid sensor histidine kinase/response regulator [candidate division KSB3 bacterium]
MDVEYVKSSKILAIDDEPINLKMLSDSLSLLGFTVIAAKDGPSAFRVLETESPDLILLDVRMPGMNGFDVCRTLKSSEATRDIPVIFMTALSETADKLEGFDAGGIDYVTKPIHQRELWARIVTHLTVYKFQQQLRDQNKELEKLNTAKDTFLSIISHDLRGPFNVLLPLTKLIDEQIETQSKESIKTHVKKLRSAAERVYALLENLLTWSRIQRGCIEYHPQEISLNGLLQHNENLFAHLAEQKNIQIISSAPEDSSAYADCSMVDTVIRNLLSNALKFTPEGGRVELTVARHDCDVEIAVADTGTGVPEEHLHKLFRLDAKYTRQGTDGESGTGLGLILCRDLVEKNGGRIWIESKAEEGSTLRFTLPCSASSTQ